MNSSLELGIPFTRSYFFIITDKTDEQQPFAKPLTVGMNKGTKYKAGLKHGVDLGLSHEYSMECFGTSGHK